MMIQMSKIVFLRMKKSIEALSGNGEGSVKRNCSWMQLLRLLMGHQKILTP